MYKITSLGYVHVHVHTHTAIKKNASEFEDGMNHHVCTCTCTCHMSCHMSYIVMLYSGISEAS